MSDSTIPCAWCGDPFVQTRPNKRYCSFKCCRRADHRRELEKSKREGCRRVFVCRYCGSLFRPRAAKYSTFCSRAHCFAYWREHGCAARRLPDHERRRREQERAERIAALAPCRFCGGSIVDLVDPYPWRRRYCSPACALEAKRRASRRPPHQVTCLVCGVEATTRRRLFCSARCARIYTRIKQKIGWSGRDPLPTDYVQARRVYGLTLFFLQDPTDHRRALAARSAEFGQFP
jgi:hypothetical protein